MVCNQYLVLQIMKRARLMISAEFQRARYGRRLAAPGLSWLLAELDMPYTLVNHQRDPITHLAPESLQLIHPLAKAPIMVDGDTTLCESGAIMEYLLNQTSTSKLRPPTNSPNYYQYLEWLHFAEGSLGLPVIARLMMGMETRDGSQPMDRYIAKEIALDFGYIEQTLSQQPYFADPDIDSAYDAAKPKMEKK